MYFFVVYNVKCPEQVDWISISFANYGFRFFQVKVPLHQPFMFICVLFSFDREDVSLRNEASSVSAWDKQECVAAFGSVKIVTLLLAKHLLCHPVEKVRLSRWEQWVDSKHLTLGYGVCVCFVFCVCVCLCVCICMHVWQIHKWRMNSRAIHSWVWMCL